MFVRVFVCAQKRIENVREIIAQDVYTIERVRDSSRLSLSPPRSPLSVRKGVSPATPVSGNVESKGRGNGDAPLEERGVGGGRERGVREGDPLARVSSHVKEGNPRGMGRGFG